MYKTAEISLTEAASPAEVTGELIHGEVDIRLFRLLLTVSMVRNPRMQQALEDVLVHGLSRRTACDNNAVSQSYFSQKYHHIQMVSHTVSRICQVLNDRTSQ